MAAIKASAYEGTPPQSPGSKLRPRLFCYAALTRFKKVEQAMNSSRYHLFLLAGLFLLLFSSARAHAQTPTWNGTGALTTARVLAGCGEVEVVLTVDGQSANRVRIQIR